MADRQPHALITGGAGFIGSHLAEALVARGDRVTVIDNLSTGRFENIKHLVDHPGFRYVIESVTNEVVMDRLAAACDAIYHLAAAVGVELIISHPVQVIETNVLGTQAVLEAASRYRRKVLLASTSEIYGKSTRIPFREDDDRVIGPTAKTRWCYSTSKALDEFLALAYWRQKQLPVVIARLFNTVGPRQTGQYGMVVPRFAQQALAGGPLSVYGTGEQTRCFCDVRDVVRALMLLVSDERAVGEVFNVGSTDEISIGELARLVARLVKEAEGGQGRGPAEIERVPYDVAYGPEFEDMQRRVPDTSRIQALGWEPERTLSETLQEVIAYYLPCRADADRRTGRTQSASRPNVGQITTGGPVGRNLPPVPPNGGSDLHIVVIGMGYVGIPCAALLADVPGFHVTGIQRRSERSGWKIDCLNRGECPFAGDEPGLAALLQRVAVEKHSFHVTDDYAPCELADVILIDVQTPTDGDHVPHYDSLREASAEAGRRLRPGTLVIIESTVAPGTTQHVVQPILERESGLKAGPDFHLAFSYERVMPGKLLQYITDFPRVVGGIDTESAQRAVALYRHIVREEITPADVLTAEMAKVVENAYRDVNIAFANEVALACERMGVDAFEMRALINARPDRNMHLPGAGVGGHCLPKDSWLLKYGLETYGREPAGDEGGGLRLIPLAREINDGMPAHMLALIEDALAEAGRGLPGAKVAILGVSYLENADDTRNTPAAALAKLLLAGGAEVVAHDPHAREADWRRALGEGFEVGLTADLGAALAGVDCAGLVTAHREYAALDPGMAAGLMRSPVLVDGRNALAADVWRAEGFIVRAIGKERRAV